MRWNRLVVVVLVALLLPALRLRTADAAEPVRIDLKLISEPQIIDGGRTVFVLSRNQGSGSFWATVDAGTGKVIRRVEIPRVECRGAAVAAGAPIVVIAGKPGRGGGELIDPVYLATWDLKTGKELAVVRGINELPEAIAITPDGTRALTAHRDRPLRLFDLRAGREARIVETDKHIGVVAISADGKRGVLGGGAWDDEGVYLWDLAVNQQLKTFTGHRGKITHVSFWPDERHVLSASEDGTIRLWDAQSGSELRRMRSLDAPVVFIAPHPTDGRRVLAASNSPFGTYDPSKSIFPVRDVRVWDALTGKMLGESQQHTRELVESFGFASGGEELLATLSDYTIERRPLPQPPPAGDLDLSLARPLIPEEPDSQIFAIPSSERFRRMGFLPNGNLFSLGERNAVTRWDVERGVRIGVFVPPPQQGIGDVLDISADGRLAVSERGRNAATVWELASGLGTSQPRINTDEGEDEDFVVVSSRLSPDARLLALGISRLDSKVHRVRFFHTSDGTSAGQVELPGYGADPFAYAPDGSRIAVADIKRNESVGIFDLDSGKQVKTLRLPKGVGGKGTGWTIMQLRFSADGSRVMTEASDRLICWSIEDEKVVGDVPLPRSIQSIAFSADGRRALTGGSDSNVRVWDLATKKQIAMFDHPHGTPTVIFSPDGKRAIAGGADGTLYVFRLPE